MRGNNIIWKDLDWISIAMFGLLMLFGWLNIYAAIYDDPQMIEGMNMFYGKSGKQFLWICVAIIIAIGILILDFKLFFSIPYVFYAFMMVALVGVLIVGVKINGSRAWYDLGLIRIQPAEFTKYALALGLTKFISDRSLKYDLSKDTMILAGMVLLPSALIILENETGSILVFASLIIVFYRDGLNTVIPAVGLSMVTLFVCTLLFSWYPVVITLAVLGGVAILLAPKTKQTFLIIGLGVVLASGVVYGTDFFVHNVLRSHQQDRIEGWLYPEKYPKNFGYQVIKSKTAIGSGGFSGKGYLEGDLTRLDFVPEQHTDFIFCTIGEEHGWLGSAIVISLYIAFLLRLVFIAERQKSKFSRTFGYCVLSIFFFHFIVNVGMTIGIFPVIGIPLPLFSYGGSSLWAFTMMLFTFLNLDMHRAHILSRN